MTSHHRGKKTATIQHPLFDIELLYVLYELYSHRDNGLRYTELLAILAEKFGLSDRVLQLRVKRMKVWGLILIGAASDENMRPFVVYRPSGLGLEIVQKLDLSGLFSRFNALEKDLAALITVKQFDNKKLWDY